MTKWDKRFLDLANHVAQWSKDPSTKVGAVLVRPNRTILSVGYNGFPRGIADTSVRLGNRQSKYSRMVHAEMNAILNASEGVDGCSLYVTVPICDRCAVHVIQSGIRTVVTGEPPAEMKDRWFGEWQRTIEMFEEAGIRWHSYI